jgi:hypothetical protein
LISMEEDLDPQPVEESGETEDDKGLFGVKTTPEDRELETNEGKPVWLTEPPRLRVKKPWPKIANFSPYRTKLAGECLQRFVWRYTDKRRADSGYQAGVGKMVHGAYEDAIYRRLHKPNKKEWKGLPRVASTDELLHLLEFQATQFLSEKENVEVTTSMLKEARELIKGSGGLDCSAAWGVEHTATLKLGSVVVGMYLDYIQVWGNPARKVVITDFKTGRLQLPTDAELYADPQPGLYLAWARDRFPTATDVSFELRNIRHNRSVWLRYRKSHDEIHRSLARSRKFLGDSGLRTPNPGDAGENCRYCPYRDGDENYPPCAAYADILSASRLRAEKAAKIAKQVEEGEEPDKPAGGLAALALPDLMLEYRLSDLGEKLNKDRKDTLRPEIINRIPEGQKNYRHGDLLASKVKGKKGTSYNDVQGVIKGLVEATGVGEAELMADIVKLKKGELDTFIQGLDKDKQERCEAVLSKFGRLSLGKETLRVSKTKGMF